MTKRKEIFEVNVDVRKILEGSFTTSKEAPKAIKQTNVLSKVGLY